ncbi:GNAT family N-acetyltransferase [Actinoplanes sp. NPDC048796]|uniref:GNAT family N-acetyltransferase n=1 Tax=unclassified Actinoplanes TaxID=2626549 RepID=UPI0033C3EC8B
MIIRPATVADVERLADIVVEAGGYDAEWRARFVEWSRRTIVDADPANVLSVIEVDGAVAGRLRVVRDAEGLRLAGIQLDPAVRNRGLGTEIVRGLERAAARDGVPVLIGVEKDNHGARRLYERLGYRRFGETEDEFLYHKTVRDLGPGLGGTCSS